MKTDDTPFQAFDQYNLWQKDSLPQLTANRIRAMINNKTLEPGARLPNEIELAEVTGVSRGTIRAALSLLEQQGLIWRRQGLGSFISEKPVLENRLDTNNGVTELIKSMGLVPGCPFMEINTLPADDFVALQLQIPVGSPVICIRRTRTANDRPVISSTDIFSAELLKHGNQLIDLNDLKAALTTLGSIYSVFENELRIRIDYGITKLRPVTVDAKLGKKLGFKVKEGSVMLYLEQVDYDPERTPLILSHEYHVADFCAFTIYRKH